MAEARIIECDEADYHNDPCETPSLSSSIAKTLLEQSPRHAHLEHPKLGGHRWKPSKDMDAGSVIHALILRSGEQRIVEVVADDFTTKAAKTARDEAYEAGKVPIVSRRLDALRLAALRLTAYMQGELGIILAGKSEASFVYEQDSPGGPVLCRSRLDHFIRERAVIYDLKKIPSAHPSKCEAQIASYGYDIQGAAYTRAVGEVFPELVGRVSFVLLFCEIEPPYVVTPIELDGQFSQLGETKWDRAVTTWGACLRANTWPAYAERGRVLRASPPRWALARELAEAI